MSKGLALWKQPGGLHASTLPKATSEERGAESGCDSDTYHHQLMLHSVESSSHVQRHV